MKRTTLEMDRAMAGAHADRLGRMEAAARYEIERFAAARRTLAFRARIAIVRG